jgi:hypothetical protein
VDSAVRLAEVVHKVEGARCGGSPAGHEGHPRRRANRDLAVCAPKGRAIGGERGHVWRVHEGVAPWPGELGPQVVDQDVKHVQRRARRRGPAGESVNVRSIRSCRHAHKRRAGAAIDRWKESTTLLWSHVACSFQVAAAFAEFADWLAVVGAVRTLECEGSARAVAHAKGLARCRVSDLDLCHSTAHEVETINAWRRSNDR